MACPYFCPVTPLPWSRWQGKLRPPLGEPYSGGCRAREGETFEPSGVLLLESCNLGYASNACDRFPSGEGPDAVRFCIAGDESGVVQITFVMEKSHLPGRHGSIEYHSAKNHWRGVEADSVLHRQAEAYLRSYLRWKEATSGVRP